MNRFSILFQMLLMLGSAAVSAQESAPPLEAGEVVRQSGVSVTLLDVDGRVAQIPPDKRAGYMNDPERIEQSLRGLLLQRVIARQAEELGIAEDPVVKAEIEQARIDILARRRLARYMASLPTPDFSALAHEKYLASPEAYSAPETWRARHLLVMFRNHGVDGAMKRAEALRAQWLNDGGDFEAFVKAHSEEEGAKQSGGLLERIAKGDTEPDFEAKMISLNPGEISEPIRTKYGYHMIQLISKTERQRQPYESVKPAILEQLASQYRISERDGLLGRLRSSKLDANPELVASLRTRYLPDGEGQKVISKSERPAPGEYERYATGGGN